MEKGRLAIMALNSGKTFANRMVEEIDKLYMEEESPYSCHLIPCNEVTFANKEVKATIERSVRGLDVYIVQMCDDPNSEKSVNDNIMALATAVNAAWYSDAARITVVIPQYPYSRQDKKKGREAITARIFGNLMKAAGANKILTLDLHSEAIEGFFDELKIENIHAGLLMLDYIKKTVPRDNLIVTAPDVGSAKRALFFAKRLDCDMAIIEKVRDYSKTSVVSEMRLVGEVAGKNVFINDDMLATGGTLLNACRTLKEKGAQDIYISVSLPFFSDNAFKKFDQAYKEGLFKKVIGTDAVPWSDGFKKEFEWYDEISVVPLFSKIIYAMNHRRSVSRFLD